MSRIGRDTPFWVRVDYRVQDRSSTRGRGLDVHIADLIDTEPAPGGPGQGKSVEGGPFRIGNQRSPSFATSMHSLQYLRLIAAFVIATVLPLAATIGITMSLLESSLGYATTGELDGLSRTLEATVRQFYQREREALRQDAAIGRSAPTSYLVANIATWPEEVRAFWESTEPERFGLAGPDGDRLDYMRRSTNGVDVYARTWPASTCRSCPRSCARPARSSARSRRAICVAASR